MNKKSVIKKPSPMLKAKSHGFTLAEVLITLGIIGVVAAMTIPTLIANINGAKYRSQFKKSLSTLAQAGRMSLEQNGYTYSDSGIAYSNNDAGVRNYCLGKNNDIEHQDICHILRTTLSGVTALGELKDLKTSKGDQYMTLETILKTTTNSDADTNYVFALSDGSIVAFFPAFTGIQCTVSPGMTMHDLPENCYGFIDVNGLSLPNKVVSCTNEDDTKLLSDSDYAPCVVKNDANHMTDIFPIVFHDSTVEPASNAARYVLDTAK